MSASIQRFGTIAHRPSRIGNQDVIGNAYEYLISRFAADSGKKGGEFYTPSEVATLLAKLLKAKPGDTICDPACGSGSLLIRVAKEIEENEFNLNIPRYVDTFEPEPEVDIPAVRKEIAAIEDELAAVDKELNGYLKELGL